MEDQKSFGEWTVKEWQEYCMKRGENEKTIDGLIDLCNKCQFHKFCDDVPNGWDILKIMTKS